MGHVGEATGRIEGRARRRAAVGGVAAWLAALGTGLDAQVPRSDELGQVPVGRVVEQVRSASSPGHSWALYVPSSYDPARRWPVLFAMDPRGQALLPLERLVAVAEELGYVVLSSYDSASDFVGADPNEAALAAMLDDAQALLSLDPRRVYLVGFSGTTRASWSLGMRMLGNVAGIIGSAGGLPTRFNNADLRPLAGYPEFGFYGAAGVEDFTYPEMRRLAGILDRVGVANALEFFPGPHAWATEEILRRAVEWMDVRAMANDLRPRDDARIAMIHGRWMAHASALEAAGELREAHRAYDRAAAAFDGLLTTDPAADHAGRLGALDQVRRVIAQEDELQARSWALVERYDSLLFQAQVSPEPIDPDEMADALDLDRILADSRVTDDPLRAEAGRRMLEHVYGQAWFYHADAYLRQGRPLRAHAMLDLAERIFPERPWVCLARARTYVLEDRTNRAITALRCAIERGLEPSVVERDPALAPLRDERAFQELIGAR